MAEGDWPKISGDDGTASSEEGSGTVSRVLSRGTTGATGTSTASRRSAEVLGVSCGGGEGVRGTLWGDSGVVSVGNVVVCAGSGWGAVVESSVHGGLFPGDVVVSGVFGRHSRGGWGMLPSAFRL